MNNIELAEMVCTRISHDLIGNIGALASTLELIAENHNVLENGDLSIISNATETLKARQKFFRVAFGFDTKDMEFKELRQICTEYLQTLGHRTTPISLECSGVSTELSKIFCLCVMIAAEVCIKGGKINVFVNKENMLVDLQSEFKLSAQKIDAYRKILADEKPEENISQYVQLIYLRELLGKDVNIKLDATDNKMSLVIG